MMGFVKIPNVCSCMSEYGPLSLHGEGVEYGCPLKVLLLVWVARGSQEGLGWDITSRF